jgi:hypothetical protein
MTFNETGTSEQSRDASTGDLPPKRLPDVNYCKNIGVRGYFAGPEVIESSLGDLFLAV